MFNQLRLKLTITNVLIMFLLILLLTASIYFLMVQGLSRQTEQYMRLIALNIDNPSENFIEQGFGSFYIETNSHGLITKTSRNISLSPKNVKSLLQKALLENKTTGKFELNGQYYRFLKVPSKNGKDGIIVVFANAEPEEKILNKLLAIVITVGVTGLVLSFFGSLFMTDKALVPIHESLQRQKDFLADASHELRTPLSVIQTNFDVVMSDPEQTVGNISKWLERIRAETRRMINLVNDLLFLARADSQQQILEMGWFSLSKTVQEAFSLFEPVAKEKTINIKLWDKPNMIIYGDEQRIKQLIVILLDNAIKHTFPGGDIRLETIDSKKNVEIVITDNGEGIEAEHLSKIFERFYRVNKSRSRQEGGTGLGLSIAQWIVKSHGGVIKVASTLKHGTTFSVILPTKLPR